MRTRRSHSMTAFSCSCHRKEVNVSGRSDPPTPISSSMFHRLAFTVWHTALFLEQNHDGIAVHQSFHLPKSQSLPGSQISDLCLQSLKPKHKRYSERLDMDLTYITERIIGVDQAYRANLLEVTRMLKTKHGDKYMVFNLSERRNDIEKLNQQVLEFGWPKHLAPPLERLCSICKAMDSWLSCDLQHIIVLHSKGGSDRVGIVIEAYRHYSNICSSADQALDRFAMKRFYDDKIGRLIHPSQLRYIRYFSGLLSGAIKINSNPLFLHHITINGIPKFDGRAGCCPFIKIYQGLQPVYSSGVYHIKSNSHQISINLETPLQLRGDILIKCYHKKLKPPSREVIFRVQFHTCAISDYTLTFSKSELDDACNDERFPDVGQVELKFSNGPSITPGNHCDVVSPVESSTDILVRWDSYENFDVAPEDILYTLDDLDPQAIKVNHTHGPVDGSLYATVSKKKMANGHVSDWPFSSPSQAVSSASQSTAQVQSSKLDEALTGMLQDIQSIPDVPLTPHYITTTTVTSHVREGPAVFNGVESIPLDLTASEAELPYHARKDSQPFTYLASSSPSMQRRHMTPIKQIPSKNSLPPPSPEEYPSPILDSRSFENITGEPGSWLLRQQQKLRERNEARVHADRHDKEQKLIHELRFAQNRIIARPSSHDDDEAYLSDTLASLEAFSSRETSPIKGTEGFYSTPLHINTYSGSKPPIHQVSSRGSSAPSSPLIPSRTTSRDVRNRYGTWQTHGRSLQRQRSDTSHDREKPFVAVKRAHEQVRRQWNTGYSTYQQSMVSSPIYASPAPLATSSPAPKSVGLLTTIVGDSDRSISLLSASPVPSKLEELQMSLQAAAETQNKIHSDREGGSSPGIEDRPATPGFPVQVRAKTPASGLPPKSPTSLRHTCISNSPGSSSPHSVQRRWPSGANPASKERSPSPSTVQQLRAGLLASQSDEQSFSATGQSSPSVYFGQSRRSSLTSLSESAEVITHTPLFVKDTSKFWYKPNISREEAINMLKDKTPGTFVVRDSNSFPGAYGLALKVATPPPNVQAKSGDLSNELVRHFLIEPTTKGVKLKGCSNEPVFGSLSALVYQHSVTPLALPCRLVLPESDPGDTVNVVDASNVPNSAAQLLAQGAACNVLYLNSIAMELLTGPEAMRRATKKLLAEKPARLPTVVHFKVSSQGITITDNQRKLFFRRHYPVSHITHCGLDPESRNWTRFKEETVVSTHKIFGFVATRPSHPSENECHLFAELEPEQPAFAIVNFVTKVMMVGGSSPKYSTNV